MKRRAVIALAAVLALVALGWAGRVWYASSFVVSTDDAYVEGTAAPVSAKVAGQVVEVLARDNLAVKAGDVLARIDERDWLKLRERGGHRSSTALPPKTPIYEHHTCFQQHTRATASLALRHEAVRFEQEDLNG